MEKWRGYDVIVITGTTDASGDAVVTTGQKNIVGEVVAVVVDGTLLSDGADLDLNPVYIGVDGSTVILGADIIDNEDVGNATLNEFYPRLFEQTIAGADINVATNTKVTTRFALGGCALRVTVANGGATKAFKVWVVVAM
ncbi:MAG: hypothetical protein AMJ38_00535 [Dehalococcoidia bacterium DG_22]|nr:MAG: hypothetical protein AMJ38_00535 [Dehalococcoidia bacterium DG_22]